MKQKLVNYIQNNILPLYNRNDRSHQLWHIKGVIDRSLELAKDYDVDINMVYTIAAFHDIGNYISRENHEIESANIFIEDKNMKLFFNDEQRRTIKEAIEDHRASLKYEQRSIYGKIIATADKLITIDDVLKSVHLHTLENFPDASWEEALDKCYQYLNKKYGEKGYAKVPLPYPKYDQFLIEVRKLLNGKDKLSIALKEVDDEIKKELW